MEIKEIKMDFLIWVVYEEDDDGHWLPVSYHLSERGAYRRCHEISLENESTCHVRNVILNE